MTLKFLVVDDEEDTQQLLKRRFRREIRDEEFEFVFAFDGQEALVLLEEDHNFDIALIDINMPRMDGLTLLERLRNNSYVMKFIVLSGHDDLENIRAAMNCGAFDFVPKPINFDDLINSINKSAEELNYLKERIRRRNAIENERKIYERELDIGRKIQSGFLPQETPEIEGWKLNTYFQSARQVAGDFFDVFAINGHSRIGLVVADVCDKGVGAALFMTLFRSLLRSTAKFHEYADVPEARKALYIEQPDRLLKRCVHFTNNYIAITHGHTSMFASLFFAFLDPTSG
ncbi:MAG: response regulator, partial [Deltaproteobacteria bacterium]|nr:response regulator [Deltaproteobacteria bacterium]